MTTYDGPIYVSPFLGAGADWLCLLHPDLVPLVSWMGGKRRLARQILALLGMDPGFPIPAILGDASWWGWVWPVVLDAVLGPRACAILRSWRGEDPRQLWFRLRDMGPVTDDVAHAAAQLLWLQARAASGVPVWWEGAGTWRLTDAGWEYSGDEDARMVAMSGRGDLQKPGCKNPELLVAPGDGRERQLAADRGANGLRKWDRTRRGNEGPANQAHAAEPRAGGGGLTSTALVQWAETRPGSGADAVRGANAKGYHGGPGRLLQHASTQIDEAGQSRATEPKLLASDGRDDPRVTRQRTTRQDRLLSIGGDAGREYEAGHKGTDTRGGGGIVDPGTIAERADAIRHRLVKASGGLAALGPQDGQCAARGWRVLQPYDIADRADRVRAAAGGPVAIYQTDARELTDAWAPRLGSRARVYADPPYQGKTGYPVACPREDVLYVLDTWARHGARVVGSEALPLAGGLGPGWVSTQLRGGERPEWVTSYGCEVGALRGPLLRGGA